MQDPKSYKVLCCCKYGQAPHISLYRMTWSKAQMKFVWWFDHAIMSVYGDNFHNRYHILWELSKQSGIPHTNRWLSNGSDVETHVTALEYHSMKATWKPVTINVNYTLTV